MKPQNLFLLMVKTMIIIMLIGNGIFIMTVSKCFESLSNTGRAFCSGGDVVSLYKGDAELQVICFVVLVWFWSRINIDCNALNIRLQATYLKEEYALDLAIHKLAVPYVSIMDGITMGGGCGISVNGRCS